MSPFCGRRLCTWECEIFVAEIICHIREIGTLAPEHQNMSYRQVILTNNHYDSNCKEKLLLFVEAFLPVCAIIPISLTRYSATILTNSYKLRIF